ncbi:hypothetical protein [Streptomyces virginiae]|uniref:hypothetical protein n=1 Tax=Streptomyces virginiae TaxID=1961 RepID=UPI0036BE60E6
MRIGDAPEAEIASVDFPVDDHGIVTVDRKAVADMFREAADAIENPEDEEVPDVAPR